MKKKISFCVEYFITFCVHAITIWRFLFPIICGALNMPYAPLAVGRLPGALITVTC